MAEEKYTIPGSPQYSENIRKIQDEDLASASTVFNPLIARLIENTAAVKKQVDDLEGDISTLLDTINGEAV